VPKNAVWRYPRPNWSVQHATNRLNRRPPESCFRFARKHALPGLRRLYLRPTLSSLRGCLAAGFPFTIVIKCGGNFNDASTTGKIPMPNSMPAEPEIHAMVVVGYNDRTQRFIVRNSYGTGWGKGGYGTIPYKYVLGSALSDPNSLWTLEVPKSLMEGPRPPIRNRPPLRPLADPASPT